MMVSRMLNKALTSALVLWALILPATPTLADAANSSTNSATITFSLSSVVYTDSQLPVESFLYSLDGEPSDCFNLLHTFVYTLGDGTGSSDGSVTLGGITHNYGQADPDYSGVTLSDDFVISLETYGESSTPGSNGSAAIENSIDLPFFNGTDDGVGDPAAITVTFDYNYNFSMALVEDAPAGGAGNGFYTISAYPTSTKTPASTWATSSRNTTAARPTW